MHPLQARAEQLEREQKFADAADLWAELAALGDETLTSAGSPGVGEVRAREAAARHHGGNVEGAIAILEGLNREGENPEVLGLLTRALLDAGRAAQAIESGKRALVLDPHQLSTRQLLGRAHKALAERASPGEAAIHWQLAIDYFTDILVIYSPRDEVVQMLKLECVRRRDDSFAETMRSGFRRFEHLFETGDQDKAMEVLNSLVQVVIEHAVDLQEHLPAQSIRVSGDFIAMAESSRLPLAPTLAYVFAQLRGVEMWAHLVQKQPGRASNAADAALHLVPDSTLPWALKASLMFALGREDEIAGPLARAESSAESASDRFRIAQTHHLIGRRDSAVEWLDRVDLEKLKEESYRPDRAEAIVARLRADIEEEEYNATQRVGEDLGSGELGELIKRLLNATAKES